MAKRYFCGSTGGFCGVLGEGCVLAGAGFTFRNTEPEVCRDA
jgi:hypothetical protein